MTTKSLENRVRRAAVCKGYLLRKSRLAEYAGLYVLVCDSRGNRIPGSPSQSSNASADGLRLR
jgi:hypothetical protein